MKIFFMCTHANQGTGYARSANKFTNALVDQGHDVVYFAFQNYKNQAITDRFIDPRIRFIDAVELDPDSPKGFGDKAIASSFQAEKPDILFLYNDLPVSHAILNMIPPGEYRVIVYLDLVYEWEDIQQLDYLRSRVDDCFVFLDCWKRHLVADLGWNPEKVHVFKLGVESIPEVPHAKALLGFEPDDFVLLNLNRNSYRKQWSITISAFLRFLQMNEFRHDIKLMCSCLVVTDDGHDIQKLIETECRRMKIESEMIMTNHIFINPQALVSTDAYIHTLYNACDVGINTCCGEGFGLTNAEHSTLGKPQIVSGIPALKEILPDAFHVAPKCYTHVSRFEKHGGLIAHFDYQDFADAMNAVYHSRKAVYPVMDFPWDYSPLCKVVGAP
jgi:hypothetical protein